MMVTIKMSWNVCDKGVVSGSAAGSRPVQADGAGGDDCANEVSFLLVTWDESAWSVQLQSWLPGKDLVAKPQSNISVCEIKMKNSPLNTVWAPQCHIHVTAIPSYHWSVNYHNNC